jgi:hypothetical protein
MQQQHSDNAAKFIAAFFYYQPFNNFTTPSFSSIK